MGPAIMTMLHEGRPDGVLLRMTLGDGPFFVIMPGDGRDCEDVMLSEMRPYPAMDAMYMLSSACGTSIKDLLRAPDTHSPHAAKPPED